ncbi:MAG: MobF family relaxase [Ilumatobacteraceae bacterium]
MLRVTTLYAGSAAATAKYYTQYLTRAPGEDPGTWLGGQAAGLGLSGEVSTEALELLLSGRDPISGTVLGYPLVDRTLASGKVVRAVAGFDATVSAPKSLSVWWALTGDPGLAECHDVAARAVVDYLERFGATTRIRSNGGRLHPDTQGLTVAAFRQTTSRADDPQLHTHLVVSSKVQTDDGRWLALDARVLKGYQRALGGLYQSVLRAELTHRYGVAFTEIVQGQAEIAGVRGELLERLSKRSAEVDQALTTKVAEFYRREGRDPSRFERAALGREAAADTRAHKTGNGVPDLAARWLSEAADVGVTPENLMASIAEAGRPPVPAGQVTVGEIIEELSGSKSAWHRLDILRTVCDKVRPQPGIDGERWAAVLDRAVDKVLEQCIDLDPALDQHAMRRVSDGRSMWIEPAASHVTSEVVLAQEEAIVTWALRAQTAQPTRSLTVRRGELDVLQADAAAAAAGDDRLVLIVGPAGAGKTTMLRAAVTDLHDVQHRPVFGFTPTAKAAQVLERETGMLADTVAKLLHEWSRPDGPHPSWLLRGATIVVDEAGMLSTADVYRLTRLADDQDWRLVLVGDPRQLQAVGRGGMFNELCSTGRVIELERIHRFTNQWEAAASLQLRHGDPRALDAYEAHGRIIPGTLVEHLDRIANDWVEHHTHGDTTAITTTTNDHVDAINQHIQQRRVQLGDLDPTWSAPIADGADALVGDIVATRRNNRHLYTSSGDSVRNRELWTVTDIGTGGDLTVTQLGGHGTVTLPADYTREHVRLGYAATEPGNQSDNQTVSITLATPATTGRGLYVAMTRGQQDNQVLVVTETHDVAEARDILQAIIASDRADTPAVTQRRQLAEQDHQPRLQPRCQIPDWFNELHRDVASELGEAQRALEDSRAGQQQRAAAVQEAERCLAAATAMCRPFDDAVDAARDLVTHAQDARRLAQRDLDDSSIFGRRHARSQLAIADARLADANQTLDVANELARPTNNTRTAARTNLATVRSDNQSHQLLDRWHFLPERVDDAQRRIDALSGWRDWAKGKTLSDRRIIDAVHGLNVDSAIDDTGAYAALANVIHQWARTNGLDVSRPAPTIEPAGIEIDL